MMKRVSIIRKTYLGISQSVRTDVTLPDSSKETSQHNHESIRRYFERLTLLETIYEKLNIESNRTSANPQISKSETTTQNRYSFEKHKEEMIDHSYPSVSSDKPGKTRIKSVQDLFILY